MAIDVAVTSLSPVNAANKNRQSLLFSAVRKKARPTGSPIGVFYFRRRVLGSDSITADDLPPDPAMNAAQAGARRCKRGRVRRSRKAAPRSLNGRFRGLHRLRRPRFNQQRDLPSTPQFTRRKRSLRANHGKYSSGRPSIDVPDICRTASRC